MKRSDLTRFLWDTMCAKHNVTWQRKDGKDWFSLLAADVLQGLHIQTRETFMLHMVTTITIPTSSVIHTPFEPGVATDDWPLDQQDDVLPHELTHSDEARAAASILGWDAEYLVLKPALAAAETRARMASMEWSKIRYGQTWDPAVLAQQLQFYGCPEQIPFVEQGLRSAKATIDLGGFRSKPVLEMLELIRKEAPELIAFDPLAEGT